MVGNSSNGEGGGSIVRRIMPREDSTRRLLSVNGDDDGVANGDGDGMSSVALIATLLLALLLPRPDRPTTPRIYPYMLILDELIAVWPQSFVRGPTFPFFSSASPFCL